MKDSIYTRTVSIRVMNMEDGYSLKVGVEEEKRKPTPCEEEGE